MVLGMCGQGGRVLIVVMWNDSWTEACINLSSDRLAPLGTVSQVLVVGLSYTDMYN